MSDDRFRVPEPLGDVVAAEIRRLGAQDRALAVTQRWVESVGAVIAENAWPARITRDGTLLVHTSSSVWAHELTQMAGLIGERLGDARPARLRFVPGPLPERSAEPEPTAPAPVIGPDAAALEEARSLSASIDGAELRQAVARAIATALARCGSDRSF